MDDARRLLAGIVTSLDDEAAMAQAAALDPSAFGAIYERHRSAVFRYLRSRTASDDEAGELSAVTFERALAAIGRFKPSGGGLLAWLLRIARNAHIDSNRRSLRHPIHATESSRDGATSEPGPGLEERAILRSLLNALPPNQRDAVQLRFAAGLTAREIGAVLGLTEMAAQKQLERAMQALKEAYRVE